MTALITFTLTHLLPILFKAMIAYIPVAIALSLLLSTNSLDKHFPGKARKSAPFFVILISTILIEYN